MSQFTRKQLDTIRKQMQNSLNLFADKTDIQIEVGNCSYRGGEATFKVKVLMEGAKTREQEDLVGYKARARKKPFVLQRLRDGAEFVADKNLIEKFYKKEETNA